MNNPPHMMAVASTLTRHPDAPRVSGAARGCQFPLNLTNLACDIVESTIDDAPHDRGAALNGGRSAGVVGGAAAGFLEAEKAFRRLRVHKNIPALIHALRPTILQHQKKRIIISATSANLQLPPGHPPSKFCVDCLRQSLLPHVFTYHEVIMTNSIKITRRNLLGATAGLMAAAGLNPTSAWAQAASPAAAPAGSTAKLLPSYVS